MSEIDLLLKVRDSEHLIGVEQLSLSKLLYANYQMCRELLALQREGYVGIDPQGNFVLSERGINQIEKHY